MKGPISAGLSVRRTWRYTRRINFREQWRCYLWQDIKYCVPKIPCGYQPSLDKKQLRNLATCHFIEHGKNVVILGPPGVGKTHLSVGLGLKAIEQGYRVLFTTAAKMIATLNKAIAEGKLEEKLKTYTVPRLLIVDEIGYLPIDQAGANLFFQLISRRYEKGPVILTSNQSFGSWGEVFGDRVIATAILDRVLHHAITINIRGNSYRLKDKLKAGLIRTVEPTVN